MGTEEIQRPTIEQTDEKTASYDILTFKAVELPQTFKGLIYSRWLRSHRYGNFLFKMIEPHVYYDNYRMYIDRLFVQNEASVRLAVLSDEKDIALGFCFARGNILDYVHVHHTCRNIKIATHLVPDKISCITHWTKSGERFATERYGSFKFNPYA
jgi:hypothetical protein